VSDVGCLFCRIVTEEVPAHTVLDEPEVTAFLDIRPLFPGHSLLVPRSHYETLADVPATLLSPLFSAVQRLAQGVEEAMDAHGTFVALNNRVSQSVAHFHVHVVPRRRKDGLRGFFWPRQRYADDDQMAQVAARIRTSVAQGPSGPSERETR
jgi:histidine triad (HIT) family protein